jgi:hypothetical protein
MNYIYVLKDPITNEIRYVGKSINPHDRCRKHISEAKLTGANNHRVNWIKSLLNDGLKPTMEIIDGIQGDWEWLEQYWISQFITWGFNLTNGTFGGENPPSWKGKTHTGEYKEIRRKLMKDNNPAKNMTDEWRANISKAHKKNKYNPIAATEVNKKKVYQFTLKNELIKIWDSITDAAKGVGLKNGNGIIAVCKGVRNKAAGFKWSYNGEIIIHESKLKKIKQLSLKGDVIKIWSSISEINKTLNLDSSSISKVCKGLKKTCGGFKWVYYE